MMAFNIGVNVVEVDGAGAPAIVGAPASVGAFNILARRGVPNRAIRVTSFPKFVEQFGGYFADGLGAYLVKGFFDNGGHTAYINRIVATDPATGAAPAFITLQDAGSSNTLTLRGGFRGSPDPGSWGNGLYVQVRPTATPRVRLRETAPATVTGAPLAATLDMSAFPSLSVAVDGATTATQITFGASDFADPANATREEVRDAINRQTTRLVASVSAADELVLTSTGETAQLLGSWPSLQVTAANATLGFAAPMATPAQATPAVPTTTSARLAKINDFSAGDAVEISDGTNQASVKLLTIAPDTGEVTWTPAVGGIATYDNFQMRFRRVEFDLDIALGGTEPDSVVETYAGLSMESDVSNYAPDLLNDEVRGSRYVAATDENAPGAGPAGVPAATAGFVPLNPGRDGTPTANDFIGDEAAHTGFYAFDPWQVQLVTCERTDLGIATAALAYCARRGDCAYVGAVPDGYVAGGQAETYGRQLQGKNVYGALYGPWIKISDPSGVGPNPVKWIPPVGHVMGIFARIETARGIWKAPAGDEANLLGALDVEYNLSDAEHTNLVRNAGVNGIRAIPRSGIVIDSSRTLSTDNRWWYVNVRLLFNYVKSSLRDGLRWVRQEPNRDTLWSIVKFNSVVPFLMGLWRQGAFGTGTPEEVFTVVCDASNNPPDEVDKGNFKIEVYFYPSKPAETIIIIVGQQPSGATVGES